MTHPKIALVKKPIMRPPVFPNQMQIVERFEQKIGKTGQLLNSILAPCAEETEKMLIDLNEFQKEEIILVKKKQRQYTCKHCSKRGISPTHSYCPHCGSKIKWE